jgi:chromosome segregation ATPase
MLKKEISRMLNGKLENSAKYSSSEVKSIVERNLELEKDLKLKEEALAVSQNQALYLKESLNIVNAEIKTMRYSMNNLKKSYFKLKEGQEPDDDARVSKKSMSRPPEEIMNKSGSAFYLNDPKLSNMPGLLEPVEERLKLLKEVQDLSEASMKLRENDMMQNHRMKHLEKELASVKEQATGYKKRFEEQSVEISLLNETISYKDEKIKRDGERLKYYKSIEPEFALLRKTNKELEETCKHFRNKTDKLFEVTTKEKEKWLAKEQSYYETINSLVKEINSMKSKDDSSVESSSFAKLLEIDNENKALRKEVDILQRNFEECTEKNKEFKLKLEHVVFLLGQSDEVFKCSSCFAVGKNVGVIIPCLHLICKECSGAKCKECYSSVNSVVHPGLIDSLQYLISQLKSYCRSKESLQF